MYRVVFIIIYLLFSCANAIEVDNFAKLPILQDGRVKPIDTFAKQQLLLLSGKQQLQIEDNHKLTATEWLVELLFEQHLAFDRKVFKIANPEVITALGLSNNNPHNKYFSAIELSAGFSANASLVANINKSADESRSLAQNQLLELFWKFNWLIDFSKSMSLYFNIFKFETDNFSNLLVKSGKLYSFFDLHNQQEQIMNILRLISNNSAENTQAYQLAANLKYIFEGSEHDNFKVIAPLDRDNELWFTPWQALREKTAMESLVAWQKLATAYQNKEQEQFDNSCKQILTLNNTVSNFNISKNYLEILYNQVDFLDLSKKLYVIALIIAMTNIILKRVDIRKFLISIVVIAALLHGIAILIRCIIMSRPPVATLYESILFVGLIGVGISLLIEFTKKDMSGIFLSSMIGTILLFIANRYQQDGDTMGMLQAVLDTNFWLATHVLSISIGYSCCFVASGLGHYYLLVKTWGNKSSLTELSNTMFSVTLIALFFSVLGTILGGIWADQSWGRFWGWDPKENGAMLIVLWITFLLHGKLAKLFNGTAMAVGMVLTNVVVVLAWFGVNLLNVGLHSYGFTENIELGIIAFCSVELIFLLMIGTGFTIKYPVVYRTLNKQA